jgi:hypothetical protein
VGPNEKLVSGEFLMAMVLFGVTDADEFAAGGTVKKRRDFVPVGSVDSAAANEGFSKYLRQQTASHVDAASLSIVTVWKKNFDFGKRFDSFYFTSK